MFKLKEWNNSMELLGDQNNKKPRLIDVEPLGAGEFPFIDAALAKEKADQDFYTRAVALEGRSLGVPGMAQMARAMENRLGIIRSGLEKPGRFNVSEKDYRDPSLYTMTDILKGKKQFAVYDPITDSLPDQRSGPLTEEDLMNAAEAIRIASDRETYINYAEQEGLEPDSYMNTGFRTTDSFIDPSQLEGQYRYGNTYFNRAGYRDY
jgi:hypothetical protein